MRRTLANRTNHRKKLDMPEVYAYIDQGYSVSATAKHFGVSVSSLYKRHREYVEYWGGKGYWENYFLERDTGKGIPYYNRLKLAGRKRTKQPINMTAVYDYIDQGHTITDTAKYFGVSASTLYRRHRELNEEKEGTA